MKHYFLGLAIILLFTVSCTSPEGKAKKIVQEYISAVQNNDTRKKLSLTYISDEDDIMALSEAENVRRSNEDIKIKQQCVFDKNDIVNVKMTVHAYTTFIFMAYTPQDTAYICVNRTGENDYKVYNTQGLYKYDYSYFTNQMEFTIIDNVSDEDMPENIAKAERNINHFDIFSKAVAENDSASMFRIFPALKKHNYNNIQKLAAKSYQQKDNTGSAEILCKDSTAYIFDHDGTIIDCLGFISAEEIQKIQDKITNLGKTPNERYNKYDLEYINDLTQQLHNIEEENARKAREIEEEKQRQAEKIAEENARKARASKLKAQGVALLSSKLISNGKGAKGIQFSALNTSDKTAKYISVEVVGYNAVDDPISYIKTCQGIGPIQPGESWKWEFDEIWERGDILDSYEIKTIIIQFKDGTSKRVKLPQPLPSDWKTWFY